MGHLHAPVHCVVAFCVIAQLQSAAAPQKVPAPVPVVCPAEDLAAPTRYEAAVASEPQSIFRQIELARCYDTAWRFADAEQALLRALAMARGGAARAAAAAAPNLPLVVGADIPAPKLVRTAEVEYPDAAVDRAVRGVVAIELTIDPKGRVRQAQVVESLPWVDLQAVRAVRELRFEPTKVAGEPVEVVAYQFVRFGLPRDLVPADLLDMARVFASRGLLSHAAVSIEIALQGTRRDRQRFGDTGYVQESDREALPTQVKIKDQSPDYPTVALRRRIEGVVVLEALIDATGEVGRARVTQSMPMLDASAVNAVLAWRYAPLVIDGKPCVLVATVTVTFKLR